MKTKWTEQKTDVMEMLERADSVKDISPKSAAALCLKSIDTVLSSISTTNIVSSVPEGLLKTIEGWRKDDFKHLTEKHKKYLAGAGIPGSLFPVIEALVLHKKYIINTIGHAAPKNLSEKELLAIVESTRSVVSYCGRSAAVSSTTRPGRLSVAGNRQTIER